MNGGGLDARLVVVTTWGRIVATLRNRRVVECSLPQAGDTTTRALTVSRVFHHPAATKDEPVLERLEAFIRACLAGEPTATPPFTLPVGTVFQQAVWSRLVRVGHGRTLTYGELAAAVGHPSASRAVGAACGANRLPLILPCHRIVAANRSLGGFSGGLAWKRWLLAREAEGGQ
jgi:O-6-methylguanine DNA methyltransferase